MARAGACPGEERGEEELQEPGPGEGAGVRAGEGAGDRPAGGGGLGGSPCSSKKASRSTYSTSPKGKVRSHSSGAKRLGPATGPERPRGDPLPLTAPGGASAGPAVSRPGPGTGAEGRVALRSFSFRRPVGQGETGWGGGTQEGPQVRDMAEIQRNEETGAEGQRPREGGTGRERTQKKKRGIEMGLEETQREKRTRSQQQSVRKTKVYRRVGLETQEMIKIHKTATRRTRMEV